MYDSLNVLGIISFPTHYLHSFSIVYNGDLQAHNIDEVLHVELTIIIKSPD